MMLEKKTVSGSSLELSPLVLGQWRINEIGSNELTTLIETAIDHGVTSFDHADIYGGYTCEELFGRWMSLNQARRDSIQLVTKCGIKLINDNRPEHRVKHYDTSKQHIVSSVERSLKNLQTGYIDLLLIHRPDPLMQPEEVAAAFSQLKEQGKVRHFGVSNFTNTQFGLLSSYIDQPIVTNQIEVSLFKPEPMFDGILDYLMMGKINPMAWSPLGGKNNVIGLVENETVQTMAEKYQVEPGNLLLIWLLSHPAGIVPVLGTMRPERVISAVEAFDKVMEKQDWFTLLEVARGFAVA